MGVFFHILSTGGGSGASRITRYIAERDKDPAREGPGSRRLFSDDQDDLSYHRADRILDPANGQPDKDDLIHFSVMIEEEEFDKLGGNEKEKQQHFREAVREAMTGMAAELNVGELTWVGGIHRNSQNPHAHIVMNKAAIERDTGKDKRISRIPKRLLPYRQIENGKDRIVNGPLGEKFQGAIEKQQRLYSESKKKQPELTPAGKWEQLARNYQKEVAARDRERQLAQVRSVVSLEHRKIASSWNSHGQALDNHASDFRVALGKRLELEMRLLFAEVWHDRALRHGDTYRFEVVDQSTGEERKISDLDVRRRAAARASRLTKPDHNSRNQAIEADLANHAVTLQELATAREAKIETLGKDIGSLRGVLSKVEQSIVRRYEMPAERQLTPLVSRETLSELQREAVKLNLPEVTSELENLRMSLSREHGAQARTETEAATLSAQLNVSRADLRARETRLENFDVSSHLTSYDVSGDRWSLTALDMQIARRTEDTKLLPERAARLDLRSLTRFNYSTSSRDRAAAEVEYLRTLRTEVVRQIEERRAPLITDRDLACEMVDVLQTAYELEQRTRARNGETMPEAKYERHQINILESSAELLRDHQLLHEVHELERSAFGSSIDWQGRAVAREIMSGIAVDETKGRLQYFLESQRVASLNLGHHRTGTLREVEARTLTDYLARAIESSGARDYRRLVKTAAHEQHRHLVTEFDKATKYHEAAREMAIAAEGREPQFTDKERINLEIYAERQNDTERERYLELAACESRSQDREASSLRER